MGESVSGRSGNEKDVVGSLVAASHTLRQSLEKSKSLEVAIGRTGPRLDDITHRLLPLEAAVRPIRADRDALAAVGGHINRAVGPAAAVLKVFDAVHGLEKSLLSDPRNDLAGYLSVLKRLEEASKFLGDNSGLAIQWLEDIVEYLEDNLVADKWYLSGLKKSLKTLTDTHSSSERTRADQDLLSASLDKLEGELRRLLVEHSVPIPMSSANPLLGDQLVIAPSPLPVSVIHKLQAILSRLNANKRLAKGISIYVEVRSSNVRSSLQALNLDYLEISIDEFNDAQSIEGYIAQWGKHLAFAVKFLYETEYRLCNDVFERVGLNVWMECFAKIAAEAGILAFLQFGKTVTESKNDPIKLFKLMDIFASLNKLRLDFNKLFGCPACKDIQDMTRDLIKSVIEGAAAIFWELLYQVKLQTQIPPPADGGVPRLIRLLTDHCNQLIGDHYKPILSQILAISGSWKRENFHEKRLISEVIEIIKAIEVVLESWKKAYDDAILSSFFAMNNHYHLYKHLKGTKLGSLLGDSWLREHEQCKDYYGALFVRESWAKLPGHLSREGLILFSGGRATARDLVKKRLKGFNEAFDDMYNKQTIWVVPEKDLREKLCQQIVQTVLPVYRSYMQNYGPLVEQDGMSGKYARYSVPMLEQMLTSLFLPRPGRYGSFKVNPSAEKLSSAVADLRRTASAVV